MGVGVVGIGTIAFAKPGLVALFEVVFLDGCWRMALAKAEAMASY